MHPPGTNLFARVVPKEGEVIDRHSIPGANITSHTYTVQRDRGLYEEDAEEFRPERWLADGKSVLELEAAQFTSGVGPRVCLGKGIAMIEMYKLLPEVS
jgi:cytochrome P450